MGYVLSIDQGTTGTTVLVVDDSSEIRGTGYREHPQHFPQPGWVEHDAEAIWETVGVCTQDALEAAAVSPEKIAAVGITNQRETIVAWDRATGAPVGPTIVWQDRRTAARCEQLRADGAATRIRELTGLPVDPYFSATKIAWLLEHDPEVQRAAAAGTLALGTVDSWLVFKLSGGAVHATDASNAARTMLYDIHAGGWSQELCELFGVDEEWLPEVVASSGPIADVDPARLAGVAAPVAGIAGDQQAALFGQACLAEGQAKATYGTGAFVLVNAGGNAPVTERLISTIAWQAGKTTTYALEGSVFTAGATIQWLRDGLKIIDAAPQVEKLAASVGSTGGVTLVPAFAGLGAPHWAAGVRASLHGITRGTTRAHIARAALEAIAFRVRENVEAMRAEGTPVSELRVDGGMANNDTFLQLQADVLGVPVTRPRHVETTSLGAAFLAGRAAGLWDSDEALAATWQADRTFEPAESAGAAWVDEAWERWQKVVAAELARTAG